jgi:hypothetical protein
MEKLSPIINPMSHLGLTTELQLVIVNETGDYHGKIWTMPLNMEQVAALRLSFAQEEYNG